MNVAEIIFEVREDETDGGYGARALGHDIFTQADSLEELRTRVKDAVDCHFGQGIVLMFVLQQEIRSRKGRRADVRFCFGQTA